MWRYSYQHVNMIWTRFCFYDFYSFHLTKLSQYFPYICFDPTIDLLSTILWRKYDVIFTIPFRSVYKELHADRETGC